VAESGAVIVRAKVTEINGSTRCDVLGVGVEELLAPTLNVDEGVRVVLRVEDALFRSVLLGVRELEGLAGNQYVEVGVLLCV
jgi:hypothetical protein